MQGKKITVMGLGRFGGGVSVTRWLCEQGAQVTVTDMKTADQLGESVEAIADLDVTLNFGKHVESDFTQADLVVANPAVPPRSEYLQLAKKSGVPLTTEMNLFLERCPARCVGITGSVGKSTITAMIGHVLEQASPEHRIWVGGNIGRSLLDVLPEMKAEHIAIIELSSFQLHYTPLIRWSPHIAVVTNVTPNHIDWHGNFAAYLADKLNIVRFQDPERDVIVIEETPDLHRNFDLMFGDVAGLWRYETDGSALKATMQTTSGLEADDRKLRWEDVQLAIPGEHNRQNAAAALTVSSALGVPDDKAVNAIASFAGLPHRLRRVREIDGVIYYNDSKSSTPEALMTALKAINAPVLAIVGGYDKQSDLTAAIDAVAERAKFVTCLGQTGPIWQRGLEERQTECERVESLEAAVAACAARAAAGDVVLLSPACASWDMFTDFRARGEAFTAAVERLADGQA